MFKVIKEKDQNGYIQTHYQLSQGDFCRILSLPVSEDGTQIDMNLIDKVIFQLITLSNSIIFEKNLIVDDEGYLLELNSEETENLNTGNYLYAIRYLFKGKDNWFTPNRFKFDILENGKGDLHYE